MQTVNANTANTNTPQPPVSQDFCQMDIFADEDLSFNVRVSCGPRRFVAGGFMNPDEAQRHGMQALLAMSGMPLEGVSEMEAEAV